MQDATRNYCEVHITEVDSMGMHCSESGRALRWHSHFRNGFWSRLWLQLLVALKPAFMQRHVLDTHLWKVAAAVRWLEPIWVSCLAVHMPWSMLR